MGKRNKTLKTLYMEVTPAIAEHFNISFNLKDYRIPPKRKGIKVTVNQLKTYSHRSYITMHTETVDCPLLPEALTLEIINIFTLMEHDVAAKVAYNIYEEFKRAKNQTT